MNETKEIDKIDLACNNFHEITNNIINPKFEYLDKWLYKTSIRYKNENNNTIKNFYPRFDYGTILKVDFGINNGSELCGPHFAISLEKFDSTKNPVLTVLPLTSQNKPYNLPLNELITEEFTKRLNNSLLKLSEELENTDNEEQIAKNKINDIKTLRKMINYYTIYSKNSYACINLITTISKDKILKPKNQYDIIGRAKCNAKTMNIISIEIIKKFTNIKNIVESNTNKSE